MEGALRKALGREVAYFLEFFRTGRDGQREERADQVQHA